MKRVSREKRVQVLAALCEGCTVNAVVRMTRVSTPTILKLLLDVGHVCLNFEDQMLRDLPCRNIEADELWASFIASRSEPGLPRSRIASSAPRGRGAQSTPTARR